MKSQTGPRRVSGGERRKTERKEDAGGRRGRRRGNRDRETEREERENTGSAGKKFL